jgi:SanA protein
VPGPLSTRRFVYDDPSELPTRRFGIVLGCGVRDGQPSLVLADRLRGALELHRSAVVERLVVSGNRVQVPVMMAWLEERGVDPSRLVADAEGVRTFATMRRASRVFGVDAAVVCTNRFHIHRSVYLARAEGIDAVGLVCDRNVYRSRRVHEAREMAAWARALFDVHLGRRIL